MPSGKTHLAIELGLLAAFAIGGVVLVREGRLAAELAAAFLGGFAFSTLLLGPDLDLARSRPTRRWGCLAILWWPYAKVFRHRGLSHHIVWGPLTRIGYLTLLAWAAAAGVGAALGRPLSVGRLHGSAWAILAGIYVPNVAHTIVDSIGTRRRRRA